MKLRLRYFWEGKMYYISEDMNLGKQFKEFENRPKTSRFMFSTGLLDKQKKDIYEGDIVDKGYCQNRAFIVCIDGMFFTRGVGMSDKKFMEDCVHTYEECMTFLCNVRTEGKYGMKVIGNVHENPELLKEKDEV